MTGTAASALSTREILDRLIGFDTVSARPNMPLIDWVAGYLSDHGIASRLVPNGAGDKANLFATLAPGPGGEPAGGVVLSGHSDVVPVEGQDWSSEPFAVAERDGRLYGRGTADMKSFIAIVLSRVPTLARSELRAPIHLALSYDEEVGCVGVPHLLEQIGGALPQPEIAIIGEPTSMQVVDAHKGICALRTTLTGLEAHSSRQTEAVSAITAAAELIGEIRRIVENLQSERRADRFDPPFTTFNIGRIEGGTAVNIVPRRCAFDWEFRPVPGVAAEDVLGPVEAYVAETLLPRMRAVHPGAAVETQVLARAPALEPAGQSKAVALATRLTGANRTHAVSFAAEAGLFQARDMSVVICGPGDIAQAHQPDEFIALDQIAAGEAFIDALIDWARKSGAV